MTIVRYNKCRFFIHVIHKRKINIEFFVAPNSYCKISANATRMVKYITHCDVYFSKRKKVYITLDFGDKLSKRYCTQIRTYEFLQMLISETEAYQDLIIDTLF